MWVVKKAKKWSKKRGRKGKTRDGGGTTPACGHCQHCQNNTCSNLNPFPAIPFQGISNIQPSAPPLPQDLESEPGEISQNSIAYGLSNSYQQYMDPVPAPGVPIWIDMQQGWSTGLSHCEEDVPTCLFGFFCPCILFGKLAEEMDNGQTSGITASIVWYILQQIACLGCIYSSGFRTKLRDRYNLSEKPVPDWLVHCFCWSCAFCQEYRELNTRKMREEALVGRPILIPPHHQSMTY
ncbi:hypothetical protein SUGI_0532120 [Cryptomeria japonica]|uniref:cell number regulator 10 n=1 Tax=Cryptomeria japonica TaxID=3369 RepID=UPI002408CB1D|nr:cell number regulator 10 [Cryptomeria japonica]XP_059076219.1 cell number regulator 10 [Cryptomeria japonica]XP_059076220.1 cell number regulator 10 [Cryptomeria japonica]GLJ27143.1 hypothetical protein SUGI_0532120 [Cryptomeria japonica]